MAWGFILCLLTIICIIIAYTIGIEASVHNTTLAFLVAGTLLHNPEMEKPALIYAMFSFWTAVIYSGIIKKINRVRLFSEFKS
jgi:BASS family bile acid:Na+ symporter